MRSPRDESDVGIGAGVKGGMLSRPEGVGNCRVSTSRGRESLAPPSAGFGVRGLRAAALSRASLLAKATAVSVLPPPDAGGIGSRSFEPEELTKSAELAGKPAVGVTGAGDVPLAWERARPSGPCG